MKHIMAFCVNPETHDYIYCMSRSFPVKERSSATKQLHRFIVQKGLWNIVEHEMKAWNKNKSPWQLKVALSNQKPDKGDLKLERLIKDLIADHQDIERLGVK